MKKYFLTILIFSFIISIIQKTIEVEALSCMFIPPRVAEIAEIQEVDTSYEWYPFELGNVIFPKNIQNKNTLAEHQIIYLSYLNNNLEIEPSSYDYDEYFYKTNLPYFLKNKINVGDIVIQSGNQSVADCGGSSLTTIFDKNTQQVKYALYSGVPLGDYMVNNTIITLQGLDTPDDATEMADFKVNDFSFSLESNESEQINNNNINFVYLAHSTSQQSMWGGQPNATFVISLQQDSVINNNLCTINYSRLIRYGRIGEDVRQTQECLNNLGYNTGFADGIYGPKTYAGIREFQISQNIKVDGIVGPQTVLYLNNL